MRTSNCCHKMWENLYLVRHGESTCNEVNRFAGAIDAPLTHLGETQAMKAAKQWRGSPPDIIFTSPLSRARRTANIIFPDNQAHQPYEYMVDSRISERHFGDFTLQNKAILQRRIGLRHYEDALYSDSPSMKGGESFADFHGRVDSFFREELQPQLQSGKKVLVVAHKYVIELLSRMILGLAVDDGYDLRLPNAKIICGGQLTSFVSNESRWLNQVQDWLVLHHSCVFFSAALIGILLRALDLTPAIPAWLPLFILALATGISLARVDLSNLTQSILSRETWRHLLRRYLYLPLFICTVAAMLGGNNLFFLALLLAAPSAITGITVSRSMGGLVGPAVRVILISSLLSLVCTLPLLATRGITGLVTPLLWLLLISGTGLAIPMLVVAYLRQRHPIETANFAERNGASAILLLCLFIILSFSTLPLATFWPSVPIVFAFAMVIRFVALLMAKRQGLARLDDYIAMSYPNIFFVVLLTTLLGMDDLALLATWYLLPMFALAPLDEWICQKNLSTTEMDGLLSFLKIDMPAHHPSALMGEMAASPLSPPQAAQSFARQAGAYGGLFPSHTPPIMNTAPGGFANM